MSSSNALDHAETIAAVPPLSGASYSWSGVVIAAHLFFDNSVDPTVFSDPVTPDFHPIEPAKGTPYILIDRYHRWCNQLNQPKSLSI
jgi:hypothetical protein